MDAISRIRAAAERAAEAHGLELFDVQLTRESPGWVVRVTIDRPGPGATPEESVGIEDCSLVSRELGTILDVEDPLDRTYTLEVTSPGLDRPLRHEADFRRFLLRHSASRCRRLSDRRSAGRALAPRRAGSFARRCVPMRTRPAKQRIARSSH